MKIIQLILNLKYKKMEHAIKKEIPKEDIVLFEKIKRSVDELPDEIANLEYYGRMVASRQVSCHVLARAVAKIYVNEGLRIIDGYFAKSFIHSWLETKNGNIIDVYPVGVVNGPFLMSGASRGPSKDIYTETKLSLNLSAGFIVNNVKQVRNAMTKF